MTHFSLLLLGLLALTCTLTMTAQIPSASAAPANNHLYGKIAAADAAKNILTVSASGKTVVVALDPSIRIFKMDDKRGHPTGAFADLAVGAEISVHLTTGSTGTETPVADEIRVRKAAPAMPKAKAIS